MNKMKQDEKLPLKERYFYYKSEKTTICCCSSCWIWIIVFLLLILFTVLGIPIFTIFGSRHSMMINFTMGGCEFGSNCVSTCLYDLNKHGYSRMNFNNGLQPSSSWINVTGNITGDRDATGINVFSHSGRSVLHISIRIRDKTIVLNHRYDNGSFDKRERKIRNHWFKVGAPFKLNLIPQWPDLKDHSIIRFYVNYVLPNGTLDKIGRRTIQLSPHDSLDNYAAMESYGQIFISSCCYEVSLDNFVEKCQKLEMETVARFANPDLKPKRRKIRPNLKRLMRLAPVYAQNPRPGSCDDPLMKIVLYLKSSRLIQISNFDQKRLRERLIMKPPILNQQSLIWNGPKNEIKLNFGDSSSQEIVADSQLLLNLVHFLSNENFIDQLGKNQWRKFLKLLDPLEASDDYRRLLDYWRLSKIERQRELEAKILAQRQDEGVISQESKKNGERSRTSSFSKLSVLQDFGHLTNVKDRNEFYQDFGQKSVDYESIYQTSDYLKSNRSVEKSNVTLIIKDLDDDFNSKDVSYAQYRKLVSNLCSTISDFSSDDSNDDFVPEFRNFKQLDQKSLCLTCNNEQSSIWFENWLTKIKHSIWQNANLVVIEENQ